MITGAATGSVTEAGGVANGTPGTPDRDRRSQFHRRRQSERRLDSGRPATASANGYGTYTLTAAGVWTYTLDNSNAAVQALNAGETLTDTFTATTVDGTAQLVTITIHGANDAAVISGDTSGAVTEAGGVANGTPGMPTATGDLNSTDVDNPNDAWTGGRPATASANGYGTYTLTAAGVWTYTLDNSNAGGAGAQAGADADRHVHGHHGRRHRAGGDHHHPRRQRRRGDHRRRDRDGDRGRRRRQRHAGHTRPRPAI